MDLWSKSVGILILNSIPVHNFQRFELLQGYISSSKVDILCLSETFLNSDISCDYDKLQLARFILIRADHPFNTKWGGVCIYYRNFLPLTLINIHYLNECLTFAVKLGEKICNFVSLHRTPKRVCWTRSSSRLCSRSITVFI